MAEEGSSRRALLGAVATGAGSVAAAAAVWPAAASLVSPLFESSRTPAEAPWVEVAGEREVSGAPLKATVRVPVRDGFFTTLVEAGAVWLRRLPGGQLSALSAACPHLGCGIGPDGKGGFVCPCHDSRFSADGGWVKGPSPRAMDPLPVKVQDGRVLVQALRFATGTKTRRAL